MDQIAWIGNVQLAEWILNIAVQATVILTISLCLRQVCRKCSAPVRSSICFMTILVLLVLPVTTYVSRNISPMRLDVIRSGTPEDNPELYRAGDISESSELQIISSQKRKQQLLIYTVNILGMAWLTGTLLMAVRLGYGLTCTRKTVSRLLKIKHNRLNSVLNSLPKVFGTHSPPDIYASMEAKSPQTIGLFTPCIVFPSDLCEKADHEELRNILLHEMSHIHHNDQWTGLLQRIVSTVFWWNPFIYGLNNNFSHEREYVCDMYVSRYGNPKIFANSLFNMARHAQAFKLLPISLCAVMSTGILEKRIKKILSGGKIMKTTLSTKTSLFHIIISIVMAGLLFSVNLTMAEDSSTSTSNEEVQKKIIEKEMQLKMKAYASNSMKKLIDSAPDGCIIIVEHPEFSGGNRAPSKGLIMKAVNPDELKITAKKVAAHRTKDEMKYIGDVIITTNDSVINTEEATAVSEDQKLIIKMKSAKIKKLRS